jgi:hypothetical protein
MNANAIDRDFAAAALATKLLPRGKLTESGCVEFTGWRDRSGYGVLRARGRKYMAHRIAYVAAHGDPGRDLVIDHLCKNTSCFNVVHLEAVSDVENLRRGWTTDTARRRWETRHAGDAHIRACIRGHVYDDANTRISKCGKLRCRECERQRARRRYAASRS